MTNLIAKALTELLYVLIGSGFGIRSCGAFARNRLRAARWGD
jgi:hypothetical protein